MAPFTPGREHYVYRAYDIRGALLYVGCTSDLKARRMAHRRESDWYPYARRFHVAGPFPKDVALDLERAAIYGEAPAFNAAPAEIGHGGRWLASERRALAALRREVESRLAREITLSELSPLMAVAKAMADLDVGPRVDAHARHARYRLSLSTFKAVAA